MFRVDARLEFPPGTLLQYEHKNAVKQRIKDLLVSPLSARSPVPFWAARPPIQPKNLKLKLTSPTPISNKQTNRISKYPPLRRNDPRKLNPEHARNPTNEERPKRVTKRVPTANLNSKRQRIHAQKQNRKRRRSKLIRPRRVRRRSQASSRKCRERHLNLLSLLCVYSRVLYYAHTQIFCGGLFRNSLTLILTTQIRGFQPLSLLP